MTDPLKIMDKMESGIFAAAHSVPLTASKSWQSLRTALEAQAEGLARAKVRERLLSQSLEDAKPEVRRELADKMRQQEARIARLEWAGDELAHRHNNAAVGMRECHCYEHAQWNGVRHESPAQSLAAVKAEALRHMVGKMQAHADANALLTEANHIEREAKGEL